MNHKPVEWVSAIRSLMLLLKLVPKEKQESVEDDLGSCCVMIKCLVLLEKLGTCRAG